MWAKIAAAFGTPILAAVLVAVVLVATHHTVVPKLALPSVPPAANVHRIGASVKPIPTGPCLGKVPKHFAGLAVKRRIAANTESFRAGHGSRAADRGVLQPVHE